MRIIFDVSSVIWTSLLAGKDDEGVEVEFEDKKVWINSAAYGYENAINLVVAAIEEANAVPKDCVLVIEGASSKKRRTMISNEYKANRSSRPPGAYEEFNKCVGMVCDALKSVGAITVSQDFVEGDDVIAWLAENLEEDGLVVTNDNDMIVLNGVNKFGSKISVRVNGVVGKNKYGDFDFKLVTLYKTLVGDSSDNIKGAKGFGPKAWINCLLRYGDDGMFELADMITKGLRDELSVLAVENKCKYLTLIVDEWNSVLVSQRLAMLHPEWVNTVKMQPIWGAGMVGACEDERLRKWRGQKRLIGVGNYAAAMSFLEAKLRESEYVTLDFETTTPPESDDWLNLREKKGVDVIGSTITGCGLSFGCNGQYAYYVTVNHKDSDNCTIEQLANMIALIPKTIHIVAHNAAGFELPVAFNSFGHLYKDNGWRGFIPNMVDSQIAASYWDENQPSHGLKKLSKLLLNYEQDSYDTTTTIDGVQYKMDALTATHVFNYGIDDVYTAGALWNFFKLVMQLEHTYDAFIKLEQKPMYLSAMSYVEGLKLDMGRLKMLTKQDAELHSKYWGEIEAYLLTKGWDGTVCPVFVELTPANIKQAVEIITKQPLETMVRTPSKLARLIEQIEHPEAARLASYIDGNLVDAVNKLVSQYFEGKVQFNVGSPKQISSLLYETIGMPVRLRNKATAKMREDGKKEGTARTDDAAIDMAIKMKDVSEEEASVLKSLLEMKSCNTRTSLYWNAYPNMLHWKTGRIHPELRQSSTNTRRWTSSNPNIQQQDSNPDGVRSCIIADAGYVFVSLDESSQEVRQMADYCKDEELLKCYVGESLKDTHSIVGALIAKCSYEEFMYRRKNPETKDAAAKIRTTAKVVLFASLYGAAAPKIAESLGIQEDEAQGYIDAIYKAFPKVKEWKDTTEEFASKQGYVTIQGGTVRHLAKLITSEDTYEANKAMRQSGNARIQGAGANQMKTIMSAIWDSLLIESYGLKWQFPCHDEALIQVPKANVVQCIKEVHSLMCAQFLDVVPSSSSIGIGKNYGQLCELGEVFDAGVLEDAIKSIFGETK